MRIVYILFLSAAAVFFACAATGQQTEKRIALVVGNAAYQAEALTTAANDGTASLAEMTCWLKSNDTD